MSVGRCSFSSSTGQDKASTINYFLYLCIFLCLNHQLIVVLMPQRSVTCCFYASATNYLLFLCLNNQVLVAFSTLRSKRKTSSEVRLPARGNARHFNVDRKRNLAEVRPREAKLRKADLLARSRARLCAGCPPPPGFISEYLAQLCTLTSTSDFNAMPQLSVICSVCVRACVRACVRVCVCA